MEIIVGGITSPKGYKATGAAVGIKKNGNKDLALIASEIPAIAAGVFTTNVVKAAPVIWDEKLLHMNNTVEGIVVNSGNANACTGKHGSDHVEMIAQTFAQCIGAKAKQILVASTGVIGIPLPIKKVLDGIKNTVHSLDSSIADGTLAAESIMTTDTIKKEIAVKFELSGKTVTMGAMAKGSGMIHPNMATLLSFITTDAKISQYLLDKALKETVKDSYNMISVDRDTSTNDTAIILANGLADNPQIDSENEDYKIFKNALAYINTELAKSMAKDGEGATKFITVNLKGAKTKEAARKLARSVISSNLTKAAIFGADANWGRVLCAMGYSGVDFDTTKVKISFSNELGEVTVAEDGKFIVFNETLASKILSEKDIFINIEIKEGEFEATAWGCDLTYDYVKINGDYRS